MVYNFIWVFSSFVVGVIITWFLVKVRDAYRQIREGEKINSIFNNVLISLQTGYTMFDNRVNNTVSIKTIIDKEGKVDIIYLLDRRDIAIFRDGRCIHTSDGIDRKTVDSIIDEIDKIYKEEINDIISVFGFIFTKKDFEHRFNMKVDDLKNMMYGESQDLDIKEETSYNIDDILDRISSVGIENLTKSERDFLDKYSNE